MKSWIVECKVITPLFMGGAYQQAELRTQSINGLLRWWFRIAGGSFEDEKRIFGWAGETSNQGLVRIRIEKEKIDIMEQIEENKKIANEILKLLEEQKGKIEEKIKIVREYEKSRLLKMKNKIEKEIGQVQEKLKKLEWAKNNRQEFSESENLLKEIQKFIFLLEGCRYLGFSLKMSDRDFRPAGLKFNLKISFHPKATKDDIKKFFCALWLAFNLGNFGSRARRGFGSIKIEKIEEDGSHITNNCYGLNFVPSGDLGAWIKQNLNIIKNIIKPSVRKDIPYLFENFEICIFKNDSSWQNLLNEAGEKYKNFRQKERLDDRIVFGLPVITVRKYKNLRRASPLIFKILETDRNNYTLLIIIIKPDTHKFIFHPDKTDIKEVKWNLLTNFVKSFESNLTRIYP
jgi:CRISPR-associated protein Cmr1